ncbi:MAG: CBS domain-containing protein [Candidatus Magnetobacterium sp. LHC-1]|nr:magnesium transporter [Nitrospirota bacterium]
MNTNIGRNGEFVEAVHFLSDIIGIAVVNHDKKVGSTMDVIIKEHENLPEVTDIVVHRSFGYKSLMVPWERVVSVSAKKIVIDIESLEAYEKEPEPSHILLKDYILDKKVIDMEDHEVSVVYDVKLVIRNKRFYVTDVDFSKYALFKRLGLRSIMKFLFGGTPLLKKETLSWSYVQRLPEEIDRFKGNVKLNILKEKLPEINPVDLADMLEELSEEHRLTIFNELDTEQASDTLEEIEPRVQRELLSSIKKERAAELINDMTPAQAADILAVIPANDADELLTLIDKENARKIQYILDKHDECVLNFATSYFIKLPCRMHVSQVLLQYREIAKDKDVIMYMYITDDNDKLEGVVDLHEILKADMAATLGDIMTTNIISLRADNTLLEAAEIFSRYSFRAVPVTDDNDVILGVILYRDIMNLKHRFI